jgi:hypothetical protein
MEDSGVDNRVWTKAEVIALIARELKACREDARDMQKYFDMDFAAKCVYCMLDEYGLMEHIS